MISNAQASISRPIVEWSDRPLHSENAPDQPQLDLSSTLDDTRVSLLEHPEYQSNYAQSFVPQGVCLENKRPVGTLRKKMQPPPQSIVEPQNPSTSNADRNEANKTTGLDEYVHMSDVENYVKTYLNSLVGQQQFQLLSKESVGQLVKQILDDGLHDTTLSKVSKDASNVISIANQPGPPLHLPTTERNSASAGQKNMGNRNEAEISQVQFNPKVFEHSREELNILGWN